MVPGDRFESPAEIRSGNDSYEASLYWRGSLEAGEGEDVLSG